MSEQVEVPHTTYNYEENYPDTGVKVEDADKAYHMAHAEKPYREQAHKLGAMAIENEPGIQREREEGRDEIDYTPYSDHAFNLSQAQQSAMEAAKGAAQDAGEAHDRAQFLQAQAENVQQDLNQEALYRGISETS